MAINVSYVYKCDEKLNFEPRLYASSITVSIQDNNDVVLLWGKVSSFAKKLAAEAAVKSIANINRHSKWYWGRFGFIV